MGDSGVTLQTDLVLPLSDVSGMGAFPVPWAFSVGLQISSLLCEVHVGPRNLRHTE